MINLDERFHSYLHTEKCFVIDGACEKSKVMDLNVITSVSLDIMY